MEAEDIELKLLELVHSKIDSCMDLVQEADEDKIMGRVLKLTVAVNKEDVDAALELALLTKMVELGEEECTQLT